MICVCGKHNTYSIIGKCQNQDGTQKWFHLECIDFYGADDLGDQIMCNKLGQKIWIAYYHFRHMARLE